MGPLRVALCRADGVLPDLPDRPDRVRSAAAAHGAPHRRVGRRAVRSAHRTSPPPRRAHAGRRVLLVRHGGLARRHTRERRPAVRVHMRQPQVRPADGAVQGLRGVRARARDVRRRSLLRLPRRRCGPAHVARPHVLVVLARAGGWLRARGDQGRQLSARRVPVHFVRGAGVYLSHAYARCVHVRMRTCT
jgi:hypothetical protein